MCTVAHGMGSGWEQHIARLIDQAHETLSFSAYSRRHHVSGSAPSPYGSLSSPYRGSSTTPLRSAPATFRGDRGASYRRGSAGWDESSFARESSAGGGGCPSPSMVPPPPSFSRLAGARVHNARIDGLEDRVKLEVQTVVRRDVDHRVSIAERAVEHLRHRVEELAEEVSSLGEVSRKCSASTKSHTGTLEQILAGEERSRGTLSVLEKWRADREGWCARTDDSLTSLSDEVRALTRRTHTQQKALDEAAVEQDDLAAAVKSARKAGDAAAAAAVAPVRELFLKEIETTRRRLLALEEGATESVIPQVTKALVKATAEDVAAAKGEELRTAMEAHVRGKVARGVEEAAGAAVTARREIERRLAEVERWSGTCDSALSTLRRSDRDISADVPGLQDDISALKQQLADGLSRTDESCERRLHEARQAAQQQALKLESGRAAVTEDLDDRLKKLEELEQLNTQRPSVEVAPAVAAPSASVEKVEELADRVKELMSRVASATARQENSEDRMEELNEKLCGHSLKLSCLEGLWREPKGVVAENNVVEKVKDADSDVTTAISHESVDRHLKSQNQQQQHQKQPQQQVRVSAGEGYAPSLTTPIRAGLSGFLKRLGSTSASSSSSQGEVGVKSGDKSGAVTGTSLQSSGTTEPNDAVPPQAMPKQNAGFEGGGAVLEPVSEAPLDQGCPADGTEDISRGDEVFDEDIEGRKKPRNNALDTSARPIHHRPNSGDSSNSSAESIDRSGAREDSSSHERTSPDKDAALREGRSAQVLSEGSDGERSRGVDTTLAASDEKGTHSGDNAEEATDAEIAEEATGAEIAEEATDAKITESIEHERKNTPDAPIAQDTSMQSQREGDEIVGELTRIGTGAERSVSEPQTATAVAKVGNGAQEGGQLVQQTTDLEVSGSVEGSEHSRWSLPSGGGIGGVGGVREERSVWAGLADAEDSMGSAEQAPSSVSGGRGADGKSPRSRVESYDLQQEEGDDYMVPFSPDRDSVAKDSSKSSPGITSSTSKTSSGGSRTAAPDGTPGIIPSSEDVNTVTDGEVDAATKTTPPPLAAASSAPEPTDIGGGGALSTIRSFCFSDDDDDDDFMTENAAKQERLSTPLTASTIKGNELEGSSGGSVHEGGSERGNGSDNIKSGTDGVGSGGSDGESLRADDSNGPVQTGSGDGGEQSTEPQSTERRRRSSGVLPNPTGFDGEKSSEGDRSSPVEGAGLALTRSTPAAGTWSHPDFGFSSDDELHLDLSISETSSSRQAEGKGEGELTPPSSSPIQGSYDGFDSSSIAS